MTDIKVTHIEHKIEQIKFKVARKANPFVAWSDSPGSANTVDVDLLNNIVAFGIKPKQARIWCEEHDNAFLRKPLLLHAHERSRGTG